MNTVLEVPGRERLVIISGTSSDAHTWNLVYLQLLVEELGCQVVNLGPCVPDELLVSTCLRLRPVFVVLSSVNGHGGQDGLRLIRRLRAESELRNLPVVIGGKLAVGGAEPRLLADLAAAGFDAVFDDSADGPVLLRKFVHELAQQPRVSFGEAVRRQYAAGRLVVQPRMGFGQPGLMRSGLLATRNAAAPTVGTITVDSFTRQDDLASVAEALRDGIALNGFPIASYPAAATRAVLDGICDEHFPVQVRHGSAQPQRIIRALIAAGLDATEGGPVSYCLPYGRTPLAESVGHWRAACELLADGVELPHLETFGGCMLGQLCPPSELVAISVLEAMFFQQNGVAEVSVSYAQQTDLGQDLEALAALRRLCAELLTGDWHVVVYTHMGCYPRTPEGARAVLAGSAELAVLGGAQRLIVKTVAEAERIPTITENVAALEFADAVARRVARISAPDHDRGGGQVYLEARVLVEAVLDGTADLGEALVRAFARGLLDVPYCLHPDNAGRARGRIGSDGRLGWAEIGALPLGGLVEGSGETRLTAADYLASIYYVQQAHDAAALNAGPVSLEDNSIGARRP